MLRQIDRFGVKAVMNRDYLGAGEMRRFAVSENIVNWFAERKASSNWVEWANANKDKSALLNQAMIVADKLFPRDTIVEEDDDEGLEDG